MAKLPVVSLWQPWAQWVMLGWKPIETRTHKRFASLVGKRVGIHYALKWDKGAIEAASNYMTQAQIEQTMGFLRIGGAICGTALVKEHRELTAEDSAAALIDCSSTKRYGLFLADIEVIEAIPASGKQGIWYHEIKLD